MRREAGDGSLWESVVVSTFSRALRNNLVVRVGIAMLLVATGPFVALGG